MGHEIDESGKKGGGDALGALSLHAGHDYTALIFLLKTGKK